MKAYSEDLRERVIRAVEVGRPREEVAARFEVSVPTIERWVRLKRETGGQIHPTLRPTVGLRATQIVSILTVMVAKKRALPLEASQVGSGGRVAALAILQATRASSSACAPRHSDSGRSPALALPVPCSDPTSSSDQRSAPERTHGRSRIRVPCRSPRIRVHEL